MLLHSLVATLTVGCALALGVTASYALGRIHFKGRGLLLVAILAVSMFPQVAVLSGMFFIPFAVLLGVAPKKSRLVLGSVACVSLTALYLERYLMIIPSVSEENGPVFGMPELGSTALFFGLFLATYALWARTFPMISPRLAEITLNREVHHHETETYDHEDTDKDFVHEADLEK